MVSVLLKWSDFYCCISNGELSRVQDLKQPGSWPKGQKTSRWSSSFDLENEKTLPLFSRLNDCVTSIPAWRALSEFTTLIFLVSSMSNMSLKSKGRPVKSEVLVLKNGTDNPRSLERELWMMNFVDHKSQYYHREINFMSCLLSIRFLSLFMAKIATARVASIVFLSTSASTSTWRNIKQNTATFMFYFKSLLCWSDWHRLNTVQTRQERTLTILSRAGHSVTSSPCILR